jgi:hypothetical protein
MVAPLVAISIALAIAPQRISARPRQADARGAGLVRAAHLVRATRGRVRATLRPGRHQIALGGTRATVEVDPGTSADVVLEGDTVRVRLSRPVHIARAMSLAARSQRARRSRLMASVASWFYDPSFKLTEVALELGEGGAVVTPTITGSLGPVGQTRTLPARRLDGFAGSARAKAGDQLGPIVALLDRAELDLETVLTSAVLDMPAGAIIQTGGQLTGGDVGRLQLGDVTLDVEMAGLRGSFRLSGTLEEAVRKRKRAPRRR